MKISTIPIAIFLLAINPHLLSAKNLSKAEIKSIIMNANNNRHYKIKYKNKTKKSYAKKKTYTKPKSAIDNIKKNTTKNVATVEPKRKTIKDVDLNALSYDLVNFTPIIQNSKNNKKVVMNFKLLKGAKCTKKKANNITTITLLNIDENTKNNKTISDIEKILQEQ